MILVNSIQNLIMANMLKMRNEQIWNLRHKYRAIIFSILIVFFLVKQSVSQVNNKYSKHKFELTAGFNFASIKQIENSSSGKPFFGLQLQMPINDDFSLKSGAEFAYFDFSSVTVYPKIQNIYLKLKLIPQVKIANFIKFGAGFQGSFLLNSSVLTLGRSSNWASMSPFSSGFKSTTDYLVGFDIDLYKRVSVGLNASASLTDPSYKVRTFQFSVNYDLLGKTEKQRSPKEIARQQIHDLRNGVLLVRLHTSKTKIEALRNAGHKEKAIEAEQAQLIENQKIIEAFTNYFSFCRVLFFTSDKSLQIKNRIYKNAFVNMDLKIDTTISLTENETVFIASFDFVCNDTNSYSSGYKTANPANGRDRMVTYYGGTEMNFSALVIYDASFVLLKHPFPYYSRTHFKSMKEHPEMWAFMFPVALFSKTWSYDDVVEKMNKKLLKFLDE